MSFHKIARRIVSRNAHSFVQNYSQVAVAGSREMGFNFEFNDTQRELKELAKKFTAQEITPQAAKFDRNLEYPWEIFKKAHQVGLVNGHVPEKYGGQGFGCMEDCILGETFTYGCAGIASTLIGNGLPSNPLLIDGSEEQKKKYLGRLIEEPIVAAYCATEPGAGSDVAGIKTHALQKGDEWVINGQKMFITNGGVASWYVVLARTDPKASTSKAFTFFVMDANTPGITPGRKEIMMGQKCSSTTGITFEDVVVKKENVIGQVGGGFRLAMRAFDKTRPTTAAWAVGVAERALHEATQYALQRKTFGTEIINHQAISHMLADMAIGLEVSRLITYRSAVQIDNGIRNTYLASIAKCLSSQVALKNASDAIQIFGGNGYNTEYPVEKIFRDAKVFQIYEGTTEIQKTIITRELIAKLKETNHL